ncbi:hypothetical protein GCM10027341_27230 [Spirosoma knui]
MRMVPRNIVTTDASGTPTAVPATVYAEGKPQGSPWALVCYDFQLIQSQILTQLGIKPQKVKDGGRWVTWGNLRHGWQQCQWARFT